MGGGGGGVSMWKVEIGGGGSKLVESGNWGVKKMWKVEIAK